MNSNQILIFGGFDYFGPVDDCYLFTPKTQQVEILPLKLSQPMQFPYTHSVVSNGNRLFCYGKDKY